MSAHFYKLHVKSVVRETPEAISVCFHVPAHLQEKFLYKEGQNITVRKEIAGEDVRRTYSICAAPYERELKIAIKKIAGGKFSTFANDSLKPGDELEVMQPLGRFNAKQAPGKKANYLAIAAGSGITPVISIIKHTLASDAESNFTLLYGNKSRGSIIFFEELEGLKNKYIDRFNFINILSRERTDAEINYGRINREKLNALTGLIDFAKMDATYICGPEDMIFSAKDFLLAHGIEEKNIHFELFTTPGQKSNSIEGNIAQVQNAAGSKSAITIKLDGRSFDFELAQNGESILDAALKQGADLPFACKGGVCATCKAKVLEGNVKMHINYALEADEVAAGFVLTCQSHPVSEKVVVDYDVK